MELRQTMLPPPPPPMTAFRASLGALWFRASCAVSSALRRHAKRNRAPIPRNLRLTPAEVVTPLTPVLVAAARNGHTLPLVSDALSPILTPEDDKWLRPTEILMNHPAAR